MGVVLRGGSGCDTAPPSDGLGIDPPPVTGAPVPGAPAVEMLGADGLAGVAKGIPTADGR